MPTSRCAWDEGRVLIITRASKCPLVMVAGRPRANMAPMALPPATSHGRPVKEAAHRAVAAQSRFVLSASALVLLVHCGGDHAANGASNTAGSASSGGQAAAGNAAKAGNSSAGGPATGGSVSTGGQAITDGGGGGSGGTVIIIDGCEHGLLVDGLLRQCIVFPSGVRVKNVKPVEDSFGTKDPPAGSVFADAYAPGPKECSVRAHDRYWVRGSDDRVYRTWHPPSTVDVTTGEPCSFGHEHGDDPRESPLYHWSGGVPFGITNHAAMQGTAHHRHEDHYGHKVVVQNDWEAVVGNPPDGLPIGPTGFRCYWLSKVHQGTHSGDAIGNNEHEYHNNLMCDDGAQRHPEAGWAEYSGPQNHTEAATKVLSVWGHPGSFEACDSRTPTEVPGVGRAVVEGADSKREIKCALPEQGWMYKHIPTPITSESGDLDYEGDGIDELWKPWSTIVTREGSTIFTSSAYYGVRNPARVYNDGSFVPQRDMNGDGSLDNWIPTLEVCLTHPAMTICEGLPEFPVNIPETEWWKHPLSPFNGTTRIIHPKGTDLYNMSDRTDFCTDYKGLELESDPTYSGEGVASCPPGQVLQHVASTRNLWGYHAAWGPDSITGGITGSRVNARENGSVGSGYGHEWVRFFAEPGIHVPN
jgi:hypothetical protein